MNTSCLTCFLALLLPLPAFAAPAIDRVEPMNWWTGMENPDLQILLHGAGLGDLEAVVEYPGVTVMKVERVENPNYLFVYLSIAPDTLAGELEILLFKEGQLMLSHPFHLQERLAGSSCREGFNSSDVIYLITPDRFANGDPQNDNVAGMGDPANREDDFGRHGGDLAGITGHLGYIDEMGFTALWICPVLENRMPKWSYHGYAITDFYKVDPRFGSNEEYRDLVQAAQARGLKVIMDQVVNHCGSEHWFVRDLPEADWLNPGNGDVISNHRRTTNQDPHASAIDSRLMTDGWFVKEMPDLNQRHPLLADYLIQNSIWWIEYAGLAGIRMDTWPYPDKQFLGRWTSAILREYPDFNIVGEEWSMSPAIVSYWQRGQSNLDGYDSGVPSLMDFPLGNALKRGLINPEVKDKTGWIETYETLAHDFLYPNPGNLVIFPDNHDMDRFFTQVGEDIDLFKLGLAYFLTMRGIPQIYYGTEVLLANSEAPEDHGVIRTDFPGGWPGDTVNAFTGDGLSPQQQDTQAFLRKLLTWRRHSPVIHSGRTMHFAPENGVYVYFRYTDDTAVMVALNKTDAAATLPLNRFAERLSGYTEATDVVNGGTIELGAELEIPAKSARVLQMYK